MDNKNTELMQDATPQQVFVPIQTPALDAGMIVRTIVFVLALINGVAAIFGYHWNLSIDQAQAYNVISAAIMALTGVWAWWKNNNVTKTARVKQAVANQVVVKK
jgi:SPP1 family holin